MVVNQFQKETPVGKTLFDSKTASRLNAFSFDPADLILIEDPDHPRYDPRVTLPLKPEFLASIEAHGIGQAVVVRRDLKTGEAEVVDGRQRVRAAREINKKHGECRIMVPCTVRKGDEADAYTLTVALNEHRQDDDKRTRIQKAQRLSQLGRSEADIALAMGVSVATAKRLVNSEAKTKPRKQRAPSTKPKKEELTAFLSDGTRTEREREIVRWVLGTGARP